ncbi:Mov34/MPN/PAD-1 family protein [Candidatus Nitrososphaera sp. FF02]|uniref:Mov34/MPN/PAD-1 family protein n=1 Tax=Candidatus Nitrososphaera sp. FF02 TaxID=3398226 RepID=UPI0039EB97A2
MEKLARESLPNESCAFLLGRGTERIAIDEILAVKNAQATRVAFEIPADELLRAYGYAERKGLQVAGIFHSHPASPAPSGTDKRFMEINPVVWVIYSTTENRFAAWVYEESVRPVKMA